jgi:hypothetical protein
MMDNGTITVLAVLAVVVIVIVVILLKKLEQKATEKLNQKVFGRKDYQTQQEMTNRVYRYQTSASTQQLRKAFSDYVLSEHMPYKHMSIVKDDAQSIVFAHGVLGKGAGTFVTVMAGSDAASANFTAEFTYRTAQSSPTFRFLQGKTADGVATAADEMKRLKERIDYAVRSVDPNAVIS